MSSFGKASGHRSARMAMYCAVHGPIPGSSTSRLIAVVRIVMRAAVEAERARSLRCRQGDDAPALARR